MQFGMNETLENVNTDFHETPRAATRITPQMLRESVKRLHTKRVFVEAKLLAEYLRMNYPVDRDPQALRKELDEKLDCACSVGLLQKHGESRYYLPTFREQAMSLQDAYAAFWDAYYNAARRRG